MASTARATADDIESEKKFLEYLPFIQKYPPIRDELQGMADGAGLDFTTMARLNIVELNKSHTMDRQCSTFYVHNNTQHAVGHNEDGRDNDDIFLLKAKYPSGTEIFSFCYFSRLPGFSANITSHGLIMLCNALTSNDNKTGVPKIILARLMLECRTLDDIVNILDENDRAQGQHFFIIINNKVVGIEVSAGNYQIREITGNYYHCNNYLFSEMSGYEAGDVGCKNYLRSAEGKSIYQSLRDIKDIKQTLCSHLNQPFSFCSHGSTPVGGNLTLGSFLIDLNDKNIQIGYGVTCKAHWQKFPLNL